MNPCTQAIDFGVDFGAAVGESIFADIDEDGIDELVVSVSDGFLYGLKNKAIDAPDSVIDTDPDNGINTDVDSVVTQDKFSCGWTAVVGAMAYELAIVEEGKGYVTSPPFQPVGNVNAASMSPLALTSGKRYLCVVRTLDQNGNVSPDRMSDGAYVTIPGSGGAGGGGMGGAAGMGGSGGAGGMAGAGGAMGGMGGLGGSGGAGGNAAGSGGGGTADPSGCGCRIPARNGSSWPIGLLACAALAAMARRRRS